MKRVLTSCLLMVLFFFSNCSEDELVSNSYLSLSSDSQTLNVSDPKRPVLTNVAIDGKNVTLSFVNNASPSAPEGGYELMLDGSRTRLDVTDRLYSSDKNLELSFSVDNPTSKEYQIFARWNSGYESSNSLSGSESSDAPSTDEDDSDDTETDPSDVQEPSNPKKPVISKLLFDGNNVTIEFVNFSAPSKPEGGYELKVDGKRTYTEITDRVNSSEEVVKMSFTMDNPEDHFYQIYARWNSGYISSEKVYPGEAEQGDGSDSDDSDDSDSSDSPSATLPNLKLVRAYEFEDNIGRNVNESSDGLKVHHLGRQDGKVVSVDGVGAYHFKITPSGTSRSYRQELIPRDLPAPYFDGSNGFEPVWDKEYVYEVRMKIGSNHDLGSDWTSYFSAKNDYTVSRLGSFTMYMIGDHYWSRQYYARNNTTNRNGEGSYFAHLDADGNLIDPGVDFKESTNFGSGYTTYASDINKWVKWTYHIKWSYSDAGFIKVYKNGKLFYSYNGPTGFKDDQAPYIKFGLYNSSWKNGDYSGAKLQESYVDYLRVYVPENW